MKGQAKRRQQMNPRANEYVNLQAKTNSNAKATCQSHGYFDKNRHWMASRLRTLYIFKR
jgi:hypothetical protein